MFFLRKKESEVARIIAGPGVSICDSCCVICTDILAKDIARLETEN